jgi:putative transposase
MLPVQEVRTFFVSSVTSGRRAVFQVTRYEEMFLKILQENRSKGRFLLHEYVAMRDHFHLLITPAEDVSLEKAVQYIKGGFSFRVKKEFGSNLEVWERSFNEERVKDPHQYAQFREYIHMNPVRAGLAKTPEEYVFSSAHPSAEVDAAPPWTRRASAGRG